jgi:DNA-binding transcriptional regulator YdaS (Cro superfamily)
MRAMDDLKLWLAAERGRAARLARRLDVPPSFVTKMATAERPIPFEHGAAIEEFTDGMVTRQKMFPTDWRRIWPELALDDHGAATQPAELVTQGNGEAAAGHASSVGTQLPLIHHHEGVGR